MVPHQHFCLIAGVFQDESPSRVRPARGIDVRFFC